ncbi:MAG: PilT/PilU family type 4a pilus ATPase [Candidatus Hydrogenedentes bacterium]|nr:PilT/PilU family type 4a pilus ATPase [Candidatus Hydrogenedentota bacterium]
MADVILGIQDTSSFVNVLEIAEKEISRSQGAARKIIIASRHLEIALVRPEVHRDFTNVSIRIKEFRDFKREDLEEALAEFQGKYNLKTDGSHATLTYPAEGIEVADSSAMDLLEKCGSVLPVAEVWHARGDMYSEQDLSIHTLFTTMQEKNASDIHLQPDEPPLIRIDNVLSRTDLAGKLTNVQIDRLVQEMAPPDQYELFQAEKQVSFNFHEVGIAYARCSAFMKHGAIHFTLRFLPEEIPSFEELSLPTDILESIASAHRGLFLVVGMTGCGKTTTLAAIVDYINQHRQKHILTIEHPVEYVHINKLSIISQRDTGVDVPDFGMGVTGALRHDPDVIVIGEMRNADTIRAAITAAATGHLVLSTLHANTAAECANRIVSFFDPIERDLVRLQLKDCLQGIVHQRLVPRIGGGRIPAVEVMIQDMKQISDGIISGNSEMIHAGMQQTITQSFIMEKHIYQIYKEKKVSLEHAREFATDVSVFDQMIIGTYTIPRVEGLKADHARLNT